MSWSNLLQANSNIFTNINIFQVFLYLIDLGIVWVFLYYLIRIMRYNVRMIQILKGVVILIIVRVVSGFIGLETVNWLVGLVLDWGVVLLVIIFQPEIRSALELLGRKSSFARKTLTLSEKEMVIRELSVTIDYLSKRHIGAILTIERGVLLNDFIAQAMKIDTQISFQLLTTIFTPNSTLHDGAVIIQGTKIACASALFPTTNRTDLPPEMGTRHRAALGISEITDSLTIIVSEETGYVRVAENGALSANLQKEQLIEILKSQLLASETGEVDAKGGQ